MFDLAPVVPVCLLDPPQFSAAILNLVINARDAMPNGGEVRISTETCELKAAAPGLPAPGTYLRVRVRDEGDGMSADTLRKIFDPYFTTKGELGTGLGLPQIWSYMQLAGGYVTAESAPGKGSTFDLLFPTGTEAARDDVWAQMDRWVNEGSAAGDTIYRNAPDRKSTRLNSSH